MLADVRRNTVRRVAALLKNPDINVNDPDCLNIALTAVRTGNLEILKLIGNHPLFDLCTLTYEAYDHNHWSVIEYLITYVRTRPPSVSCTPLLWAVQHRNVDLVTYILNHPLKPPLSEYEHAAITALHRRYDDIHRLFAPTLGVFRAMEKQTSSDAVSWRLPVPKYDHNKLHQVLASVRRNHPCQYERLMRRNVDFAACGLAILEVCAKAGSLDVASSILSLRNLPIGDVYTYAPYSAALAGHHTTLCFFGNDTRFNLCTLPIDVFYRVWSRNTFERTLTYLLHYVRTHPHDPEYNVLRWAVIFSNTRFVSYLLEHPEVEHREEYECAKACAQRIGDESILTLFRNADAEDAFLDTDLDSLLHVVARNDLTSYCRMARLTDVIEKHGTDILIQAAKCGNTIIVRHLLNHPDFAYTPCDKGPVYWAVVEGHLPVLKLLDTDPRIDVILKQGQCALKQAQSKGHKDVVDFMLTKLESVKYWSHIVSERSTNCIKVI